MSSPWHSLISPHDRSRTMTADLDLQGFLVREGLDVLGIVGGAAPGTRRLMVGDGKSQRTTNVVAVGSDASGWAAVESEMRHLRELDLRLRPSMRATVPAVVETIAVGADRGVVLSAVPCPDPSGTAKVQGTTRERADALLEWLMMLWEDTAGPGGSVDLGREATETLLAMFAGSRAAAPTLGLLHRARSAVARADTASTSTHGCLCPRHVRISDGRVTGVDDWGLARFGHDPLRDLGSWVVASAGPRIGIVLTGRGRTGRTWRNLVADGLGYWDLSRALWRDVLLLCLAEDAVAGLARDDATALNLLTGLTRDVSHTDDRKDVTS